MSTLLLERNLRRSEEDSEVRTLARARTLTVLGRLDPDRKTAVMQFLVEAELVQSVKGREPLISLSGADLSGAKKDPKDLSIVGDLRGSLLSDADISYADLRGANLRNADLHFAELSGALLSSANLSGADLGAADLSGAYLRGTNLRNADLRGVFAVPRFAEGRGADLSDANLSGALLSDADLSKANLSNADLSGADLSAGHSGNTIFFATDLSGANLSNADLSDADLSNDDYVGPSGANLSGADFSGADFSSANLRGAQDVTNEELEQQAASLEGATMPYEKHESKFEPALTYNISGGWLLSNETTEELFLVGPERGQLFFTSPSHVFDPSSPSEPTKVSAPENAKEWLSWFQRHPNLETSKPVAVSVGGASGMQIDVTASSTLEDYPRKVCGREPCVPLYPSSGSPIFAQPSDAGWKDRYVIVDVGGEPVVINFSAPKDEADNFFQKAQKFFDNVEWKSE
jgi:uncharacterized protein YjbI with pentapeptide repeats